jgi:hypothetical protein
VKFILADPYRKLKRQFERQRRKAHYRQLHELQLTDIEYRGITQEQRQLDEQLKTNTEWLNRPPK